MLINIINPKSYIRTRFHFIAMLQGFVLYCMRQCNLLHMGYCHRPWGGIYNWHGFSHICLSWEHCLRNGDRGIEGLQTENERLSKWKAYSWNWSGPLQSMFICRGSAEALLEDNREWESSSLIISSLSEESSLFIPGDEFITNINIISPKSYIGTRFHFIAMLQGFVLYAPM